MASARGEFSSRFGFVMAAAGSAVGLGNIWRFPYVVGENGGSALQMLSVGVIGPVQLSWVAPEENVDGSNLTDLAGYRIYYGTESRSYSEVIDVPDPATTTHAFTASSGDYYITMTALDAEGNESAYANEIMRTIP